MQRDVRSLEREVQQLEDVSAGAKKLRNKAQYLGSELTTFYQTYLSQDHDWVNTSVMVIIIIIILGATCCLGSSVTPVGSLMSGCVQ